MSALTKERVFKDFGREMHKVSKGIRVMGPVAYNKEGPWFFIVGAQRYMNVEDATFAMIMALRRVNHQVPDPLLRRMETVYGKQT